MNEKDIETIVEKLTEKFNREVNLYGIYNNLYFGYVFRMLLEEWSMYKKSTYPCDQTDDDIREDFVSLSVECIAEMMLDVTFGMEIDDDEGCIYEIKDEFGEKDYDHDFNLLCTAYRNCAIVKRLAEKCFDVMVEFLNENNEVFD